MARKIRIPKHVYFVAYRDGSLASEEVFRTIDAARRDISMHFKSTERIVRASLKIDPPSKRSTTPEGK